MNTNKDQETSELAQDTWRAKFRKVMGADEAEVAEAHLPPSRPLNDPRLIVRRLNLQQKYQHAIMTGQLALPEDQTRGLLAP